MLAAIAAAVPTGGTVELAREDEARVLATAAAGEEPQIEEAVAPRLAMLLRQLHQAVELRVVSRLALVTVLGAAEVERGGRRRRWLRAAERGGGRHEVFELRRRIAADGGGGWGMRLVLEGLQLGGDHSGEAEGHATGAVHAGADGRHPCTLLRQCVAEGTVGDEAVPPVELAPKKHIKV